MVNNLALCEKIGGMRRALFARFRQAGVGVEFVELPARLAAKTGPLTNAVALSLAARSGFLAVALRTLVHQAAVFAALLRLLASGRRHGVGANGFLGDLDQRGERDVTILQPLHDRSNHLRTNNVAQTDGKINMAGLAWKKIVSKRTEREREFREQRKLAMHVNDVRTAI